MGTTPSRARLRGLVPVGIVLAMAAALLSFTGQLPATADGLHTVTAQLRLSTGAGATSYYEVSQLDVNAPGDYYNSFTEGDAPDGVVDLDLPDGTYKIRFISYASHDEKWYATGADAGVDLDSATPIVVTANQDLGTITFPVHTVTTVVRDQDGNPVSGVNVSVSEDPNDLASDYNETRLTDSQGRAVFRNQSASKVLYYGAFDTHLKHPVYDPSDVGQSPADTSNATVDLTMEKLATISGHVVKAGTSTPLGLIQVRVLDANGDRFGSIATTLSDGSYTVTGIPAGTYTVEFSDLLGDFDTQYANGVATFADATFDTIADHAQVTGIDASLDPTSNPAPTGVDLAGVVSGRGKPLGNVLVTAYRNGVEKGSVLTGRDGSYAFTDLTSGTYKVSYDRLSGPADELPFANQWYLGSHSMGAATPIAVTEDSAGPARDATLDSFGVISGSVLDASGTPLTYAQVIATDADDTFADYASAPGGGYRLSLPPGTYNLQFDGWGPDLNDAFIPEWWNDSTTLAGATAITLAPGQTVTASPRLARDLETRSSPVISGSARVGSTLTASTGTWNLMAGNDYQYAWFRGATQVGSGSSYTPTAADAGSTLTVRVTAWHGTLTGTAYSAPTAVVKHGSTSHLTGKSPKADVVKLTVTVSVPGVSNPGGTVTIKRGNKVVKTGVAVVNGQAVVKLVKQKSGKATYEALYGGTGAVETSSSNAQAITVK